MTQYRQIIGSLMYIMNTRPDIFFVVNTLSQYLVKPRHFHLIVAKHVMKYLGLMRYFLVPEIWQSLEEIFLNKGKYAAKI